MLEPTSRARKTLPIGKIMFNPKVVASSVCCRLLALVKVLTTCNPSARVLRLRSALNESLEDAVVCEEESLAFAF